MRLEPVDGGVDLLGDGDGVRLALTHKAQAHHVLAIAAEHRTMLFRRQFDIRHFSQTDDMTVLGNADRHAGKGLLIGEETLDAHEKLGVGGLHGAAGRLDILRAQRILDISDRDRPGRHFIRIKPDAHGVAALTADTNVRNAVEHREPVHDIAVGIVGELFGGHPVRTEHIPQEGPRIAVLLGHFQVLHVIGHAVSNTRHRIPHIVRRRFDIAFQRECDGDPGRSIAGGRADRVHALNARQAVLNDLGNAVFHHFGIGAGIVRAHRNHGTVHIRHFPQGQVTQPHEAENNDQGARDKSENRPADSNIGQGHCAASPVWISRPRPPPWAGAFAIRRAPPSRTR